MGYNLHGYICKLYGDSNANETRHVLEQLQVRMPGPSEYFRTRDLGVLIFLDDAACCIRITNDINHPHIRHDRILQPLWTKTLSSQKIRIDIFPGVRDCSDHNLKRELEQSLEQDYINWYDNYCLANVGCILHDGTMYPLVIDAGSFRYFSDQVKEIQQKLQAHSRQSSIQQEVFGELYTSFGKVFPAEQKTANAQLMGDSWQLCRKFSGRGVLVPTWKSINYCGTTFYAAQYNARPWQLIP